MDDDGQGLRENSNFVFEAIGNRPDIICRDLDAILQTPRSYPRQAGLWMGRYFYARPGTTGNYRKKN